MNILPKIFGTIALFGVFLFLSVTTVSAATLSLSPTSGSVTSTTPVTLTITLDTASAKTDGTDIRLVFDPAKLQAVDPISPGTIYGTYPAKTIDNTSGKVVVSGIAEIGKPYTGKGTFATVQFKAVSGATGTGTVAIDFTQGSTTDSNVAENGTNKDVLTSVQNATLTIGGGVVVVPPATGGSPSATPRTLPDTAFGGPLAMLFGSGASLVSLGFWGLRRRFF